MESPFTVVIPWTNVSAPEVEYVPQNIREWTLIHVEVKEAAQTKRYEEVKKLLRTYPAPLHFCLRYSDFATFREIMDPAAINRRDQQGIPLLTQALLCKQYEAFAFLRRFNPDYGAVDQFHNTVLHIAVLRNATKAIEAIGDRVDPEARNLFGETALIVAAHPSVKLPTLRTLVQAYPRLSPSSVCSEGATPLALAFVSHQEAKFELLRKHAFDHWKRLPDEEATPQYLHTHPLYQAIVYGAATGMLERVTAILGRQSRAITQKLLHFLSSCDATKFLRTLDTNSNPLLLVSTYYRAQADAVKTITDFLARFCVPVPTRLPPSLRREGIIVVDSDGDD